MHKIKRMNERMNYNEFAMETLQQLISDCLPMYSDDRRED